MPLIKHQHWSGADLMDSQMSIATGGGQQSIDQSNRHNSRNWRVATVTCNRRAIAGLSTSAMGAGVTEDQF